MTRSLGEVEAMAHKAARGAGYSWGMAEDAGAAVRWLEARGIRGCGALAKTLQTVDGQVTEFAPRSDWTSPSGRLCPIMVGAALSDRVDKNASLGPVLAPVLLLPVLAFMSKTHGQPMYVEVGSGQAVLDGDAIELGTTLDDDASPVRIRTGAPHRPVVQARPCQMRADVSDRSWALLDAFATKTYAPATEASRLKGAGAGLTDND